MRCALFLAFALAATSCASATSSSSGTRPAGDDAARFETLKSLSGNWVSTGQAGSPPGAKVSYRVTAAGSAVEETVFAGTPHEMVTLYTLDQGRMVMTHYCAIGNQPHMELQPGTAPNVYLFVCTSLGNGDPAKDMHMHSGEMTLVDPGHLKTAWTLWDEGKPGDVHGFDLKRAQ